MTKAGNDFLSWSLTEDSEVSCAPGEPEPKLKRRGLWSFKYTAVGEAGGMLVGKGAILRAGLVPVTLVPGLGVLLMEAPRKCLATAFPWP